MCCLCVCSHSVFEQHNIPAKFVSGKDKTREQYDELVSAEFQQAKVCSAPLISLCLSVCLSFICGGLRFPVIYCVAEPLLFCVLPAFSVPADSKATVFIAFFFVLYCVDEPKSISHTFSLRVRLALCACQVSLSITMR